VDKKASHLISWRRRRMTKWWPSRWTSKLTMGSNAFGCQRRLFPTWRAPRRFGSQRGIETSNGPQGIWRLGKISVHFMGCIMMDKDIAKWVSEYSWPKFPFPC
jgi:hypothetical protein